MAVLGAIIIAVLAFAMFSAFLFLNTLYLQDVRGLDALHAGLCTLPLRQVPCCVRRFRDG